jgi:hypothetical protein
MGHLTHILMSDLYWCKQPSGNFKTSVLTMSATACDGTQCEWAFVNMPGTKVPEPGISPHPCTTETIVSTHTLPQSLTPNDH